MKRFLPLVLIGALLGACGGSGDRSDRVQVMASMYPAAFIAEEIGGEHVDVTLLTNPGTDPHDLELSPRRTIQLLEADVVLWFGGIQAAVDQAVEQSDRDAATTVDLGAGLGLEHEGHDDEADDHHGHDHGESDPHVWLDPKAMAEGTERTLAALKAAAPEHSTDFERNAGELMNRFAAFDELMSGSLTECRTNKFVTSHAAFGHLSHAYGLEQIAISGLDPHAEPNTATLAKVTELVRSEGITTVFTERLASDALARTVSRETGARLDVLDPIEGLTDETADEDWFSLMEANRTALQKALECK